MKKDLLFAVITVLTLLYGTFGLYRILFPSELGASARFYTNSAQKGPFEYAFLTNDTLLMLDETTKIQLGCTDPTYIVPSFFSKLERHPLRLNDPTATVYRATDGDYAFYLLVNNTKWLIKGGANGTYQYGMDQKKFISAPYSYLNNFPTARYSHD